MVFALSRHKLSALLHGRVAGKAESQPSYVGFLQYGTLDEKELTLAQLPEFLVAVYRGDGQLVYHGKASRAGLERLARRMLPQERAVAILDANRIRYGLSRQEEYTTGYISQFEMQQYADWVLVGERAFEVAPVYPQVVSQSAIDLLLK